MSATCCFLCAREIHEGESAWASDWTVLDVSGQEARWRREVRYACDECEATS
jgi:hypothetical protein